VAVTLQLARITSAQLSECRRSVAVLDRLCSFELVPAEDYLDLDWAADALIRLCEHARVGDVTAVRRSVTGDAEVNPAYRDQPYTVMGQPRLLEPRDVSALAASLHSIDLDQAFARLPSDPQAVKETLGGTLAEFIGDPRDYVTGHFRALGDFYTAAANRHNAIVIWDD
jgi:Domain of unknown function (DUF1877)